MCGFACNDGFASCLGACVPASETCGIDLPANTFVRLTQGDVGPRLMPAMVYVDSTSEYVLVGGAMPISVRPRPYDVQGLSLREAPAWRNHFPFEKVGVWGPEIGDSNDPGFPDEHFATVDPEGVVRPSFVVYPGIPSYHQYAYDAEAERLTMYLWNRTFSYDAAARTWTFHAPATDPARGADHPRLLWSAMAKDSGSDKIVLHGGANVLDDDGEPGTWIYEPSSDTWREVAGDRPPTRAVSPMVTDPTQRKALLFGGDSLDGLLSDTWAFDFATETWEELAPDVAPAPRGGHQLLFLPTSQTIALIGGFEHTSTTDYVSGHYRSRPWEIWRFDWLGPSWNLVRRIDPEEEAPDIDANRNVTFAAAAGPGDVVVLHHKNGYAEEIDQASTWALRVDPTVSDESGTATYGVAPGTITRRTGRFDPAAFDAYAPADPDAQEALLAGIADNTWVELTVESRPLNNHDWGTVAFDADHDALLRWSGGHSAHSGTDVLRYSIRENRWSIGYPPEMPLEFIYSNDQTPGQYSPRRRPWMTGHTYKSYAYDPTTGRMIILKAPGWTYRYDPVAQEFDGLPWEGDFSYDIYTNVLAATPSGMHAWTPDGLFRMDAAAETWASIAAPEDLPQHAPDSNTMVYDGTGGADRLLLFADTGDPGEVTAVDVGDGSVTTLGPSGAGAVEGGFFREAALVTGARLVVLGTTQDFGDGVARTPVYDVEANEWLGFAFAPVELQGSGRFYGVSLGLVYDESRDLLWAVNTDSELFVLRVDRGSADVLAP